MQNETVIAGFGGQGVLFVGKVLAHAALEVGMEVTWFPSYGPEMRGGTANCTVIFSNEEIGSPQVLNPTSAIVMNQPSLDKYEDMVVKDGYLIVNTSMTNREVKRKDIHAVCLPATEIAEEIGDKRLTNIVMLAALIKASDFFGQAEMETALKKSLEGKKNDLVAANMIALQKGFEFRA
ncbi:MAG TPA: 2-oxoacid:ferredoxin oxidoreductase subunit gamma [Anaerolineaceae bacterium]|uniref:Putative 2-oxoglutarate ferredoxin oxidoreductase gamma subunit n=1 Tax=Anaerolinea thermophila TaxID=167964 RepID=A0A117LGW5_9CHLR|nr:MAG: Putative 2-oxoglutarate ferredoxin oxidoreductase gamma subunit [Anaerolinea thermophila]HAF61053.1 2-oxoacid:ferredoxin oxidoreductase subunit gamma [Anaerolineaceae bacterium]